MSLDGGLAALKRAALRNSDRSPAEHGTARMPLGRLARAIRARSVDPSAWGRPAIRRSSPTGRPIQVLAPPHSACRALDANRRHLRPSRRVRG